MSIMQETYYCLFYISKSSSRYFGIFMPKHLAGQWVLNNYLYSIICITYSIFV